MRIRCGRARAEAVDTRADDIGVHGEHWFFTVQRRLDPPCADKVGHDRRMHPHGLRRSMALDLTQRGTPDSHHLDPATALILDPPKG